MKKMPLTAEKSDPHCLKDKPSVARRIRGKLSLLMRVSQHEGAKRLIPGRCQARRYA
jgi:hypothetical protein